MPMLAGLKNSLLFAGMSEAEIGDCLKSSRAKIIDYKKDEMIFRQREMPARLTMLLAGAVIIGNDSSEGKRSVIATFDQPGELFGEVFVFLNKRGYDHYAQAVIPTKILQISKDFLYSAHYGEYTCHAKLVSNMLSILAHKAYFLNKRLQVVSCATLRQKVAKVLLQNYSADGKMSLSMSREELAGFLNAARPSVSRELMKMQEEGLLTVEKRIIRINNPEELQNIL